MPVGDASLVAVPPGEPRRRPRAYRAAIAVLTVALAECAAPPPPSPMSPSLVVVPAKLPNGSARFQFAPAVGAGAPLRIDVALEARSGSIEGPRAARIVASGISGEALVRRLPDVAAVRVEAGQTRSVTITWDGRDDAGRLAPSDSGYVLLVDLVVTDVAGTRTVSTGTTLPLYPPPTASP